MKPSRLSARQNVKLRMPARAANEPSVDRMGGRRSERRIASVKETATTVVIKGSSQAQPRNTPFRDRDAPRTPTEMAPAMAQGYRPTLGLPAWDRPGVFLVGAFPLCVPVPEGLDVTVTGAPPLHA